MLIVTMFTSYINHGNLGYRKLVLKSPQKEAFIFTKTGAKALSFTDNHIFNQLNTLFPIKIE